MKKVISQRLDVILYFGQNCLCLCKVLSMKLKQKKLFSKESFSFHCLHFAFILAPFYWAKIFKLGFCNGKPLQALSHPILGMLIVCLKKPSRPISFMVKLSKKCMEAFFLLFSIFISFVNRSTCLLLILCHNIIFV